MEVYNSKTLRHVLSYKSVLILVKVKFSLFVYHDTNLSKLQLDQFFLHYGTLHKVHVM